MTLGAVSANIKVSKELDSERRENMGGKIKERREMLRMSQEDLSRKSGVSRQTISSIENAPDKNVSIKTLEKIAVALDTTVGELFF